MKSDYVIWESLQILWKVFSTTLSFGSSVLTDTDTMALKEKSVTKIIIIKPRYCQTTREIETQGKWLDKSHLTKGLQCSSATNCIFEL